MTTMVDSLEQCALNYSRRPIFIMVRELMGLDMVRLTLALHNRQNNPLDRPSVSRTMLKSGGDSTNLPRSRSATRHQTVYSLQCSGGVFQCSPLLQHFTHVSVATRSSGLDSHLTTRIMFHQQLKRLPVLA